MFGAYQNTQNQGFVFHSASRAVEGFRWLKSRDVGRGGKPGRNSGGPCWMNIVPAIIPRRGCRGRRKSTATGGDLKEV